MAQNEAWQDERARFQANMCKMSEDERQNNDKTNDKMLSYAPRALVFQVKRTHNLIISPYPYRRHFVTLSTWNCGCMQALVQGPRFATLRSQPERSIPRISRYRGNYFLAVPQHRQKLEILTYAGTLSTSTFLRCEARGLKKFGCNLDPTTILLLPFF